MDFDLFEELNEESILNLYDDEVTNGNNFVAVGCVCNSKYQVSGCRWRGAADGTTGNCWFECVSDSSYCQSLCGSSSCLSYVAAIEYGTSHCNSSAGSNWRHPRYGCI